ncbi:hypothetical protein [Pseudomonas sp. Z2-11]
MAELLQPPTIPDLRSGDWIDLEQLGDDPLLTYIKYDAIAINDVLWPNWRGCSAQGEVADFANSRVDVTTEDGYTPELGMPVLVPNDVLKHLDQGWAFYSYSVGLASDRPESRRIFCYVGERPVKGAQLAVPQIKESHGLALDPDLIGSAGATAVVPPYQAMTVGDKVTFTWQGYYEGVPENPYKESKELAAEHLGRPLIFNVPLSEVIGIPDQYAEISYSIEYANGLGRPSDSPMQTIQIVPPGSALLPVITIKDYAGGPITPGDEGLTLQIIPVYGAIQDGDVVLMYWKGNRDANSVIKSLRVDLSTLDSGILEFYLEPQWVSANSGSQVTVSYQYARVDAAESGEPLLLDISVPLDLPPPIVENATAEGEHRGWLAADPNGAYVNVPEGATIGPGAQVEMHWDGHPNGGRYVATDPVGGSGKRFFIPGTAIAANMSTEENKRFEVFYRVTPPGQPSGSFNLRIEPLASTRYPDIQCTQAQGTLTLSLTSVPLEGADLVIGKPPSMAWPFMAIDQKLTIEASGVKAGGGSTRIIVRNAVPVTAEEFGKKVIKEKLNRAFLQSLKLNEKFTLKAKVSFDGGETQVPFNDTNLNLTR